MGARRAARLERSGCICAGPGDRLCSSARPTGLYKVVARRDSGMRRSEPAELSRLLHQLASEAVRPLP